MSDVAATGRDGLGPFRTGAIALMLILGIGGFVGLVVMGAYAPDLRTGHNGGAHALSNAATGYSALVALAEATGRHPRIVRDSRQFDTEDLLVVTPESGTVDMNEVLETRTARPTLIVLPKWETGKDPEHDGWVTWSGLLPIWEPVNVLAPGMVFEMRRHRSGGAPLVNAGLPADMDFRAPRALQVVMGLQAPKAQTDKRQPNGGVRIVQKRQDAADEAGEDDRTANAQAADAANEPVEPVEDANEESDVAPAPPELHPLITDGKGGMVLFQIGEQPFFVLADPDLIANHGLRDVKQAGAVLRLLDWLNSNPPEAIAFDVSLNGFGRSRSPLKLLFEPPFLAMTLAIVVALILVGIQAFARFGPIAARSRAIAFGKAALVDNSAALIRKAGREGGMGARYAQLVRERAVTAQRISGRLRDGALDARLDQLRGRHRFTELVAAAQAADDRESVLAAARALHEWQEEKAK
jgi:hypothetical protein